MNLKQRVLALLAVSGGMAYERLVIDLSEADNVSPDEVRRAVGTLVHQGLVERRLDERKQRYFMFITKKAIQ